MGRMKTVMERKAKKEVDGFVAMVFACLEDFVSRHVSAGHQFGVHRLNDGITVVFRCDVCDRDFSALGELVDQIKLDASEVQSGAVH